MSQPHPVDERHDGPLSATSSHEVTRLLQCMQDGDRESAEELARLVYDELHAVAAWHMRREGGGHTLQTTVLVNDAFMRMIDQRAVTWKSRSQFFMLASQSMRRLLVDHARRRKARKRDAGEQVSLDAVPAFEPALDVVALNEALVELAALDARQAQIVELRYFAGLTIEATAETLGISPATVKRDWTFARAFLQRQMEQAGDAS